LKAAQKPQKESRYFSNPCITEKKKKKKAGV
jgi:hypothetical protein